MSTSTRSWLVWIVRRAGHRQLRDRRRRACHPRPRHHRQGAGDCGLPVCGGADGGIDRAGSAVRAARRCHGCSRSRRCCSPSSRVLHPCSVRRSPASTTGAGILAGLFGAMAMGTQSVIVRLLMRGVPQTNVMTGNMTQTRRRDDRACCRPGCQRVRDPDDLDEHRANSPRCARGFLIVLAIAIGFLAGAACGASAMPKRVWPARRSPS